MAQTPCCASLVLETASSFVCGGADGVKTDGLESDLASDGRVQGFIHHAHGPMSHLAHDLVAPQLLRHKQEVYQQPAVGGVQSQLPFSFLESNGLGLKLAYFTAVRGTANLSANLTGNFLGTGRRATDNCPQLTATSGIIEICDSESLQRTVNNSE